MPVHRKAPVPRQIYILGDRADHFYPAYALLLPSGPFTFPTFTMMSTTSVAILSDNDVGASERVGFVSVI